MTAFDEILWTDPWQTGAGRAGIQVLAGSINADSTSMVLTWRCWGMNSPSADSYVWYGLYSYATGGGTEWPANSHMTRIVAPAGSGAQSWIAAEWHFTVPVSFGKTTILKIYAGCQNSSNWGSETYADNIGQITIPVRPYHAPATPGVTIDGGSINCTGHQLDPAADGYWSTTWWGLEINDVWQASVQQANNAVSYAYAPVSNSRYRAAVSAANANAGGASGYSGYYYTAPNVPSAVAASRAAGSTQVNLSWAANGSRYVGAYRLWRSLNGGAYSLLKDVAGLSTTDTVPLGSTANYYVVALSPVGVNQAVSGNSAVVGVGKGYNLPSPPGVALVRTGPTTATMTITGNQNTPTNDRYTALMSWQIQVNGAAFGGGEAMLDGTTTQRPISGLPADSQIRVQACFINDTGASAWAQSGYLYTTPDAPSDFVATRSDPASSTVNLSWTDNSAYDTTALLEKQVGAGAWTQVATFATPAVVGTVVQSQAESAKYRLRVVTSDNQYSAYSEEQTVGVAFVSNKNAVRLGGAQLDYCYVGDQRIRRILKGAVVLWEDGDA